MPAQLASVHGGPAACLARAALKPGVSIADLDFGDEEEEIDDDVPVEAPPAPPDGERVVEVRFLANDVPAARLVLKRWAAVAGHERIWFRDEVCELEPPAGMDGEFATRCSTCGLEIADSGPGLLKFVRESGYFPLHCFTCGSFVPQWQPAQREPRDDAAPSGHRRGSGSDRILRVVDG